MWETRGSPSIKGYPCEKENGVGKKSHEGKLQSVMFTNKCRASLDERDGWKRGWYCNDGSRPQRIRPQLGADGVMYWGVIIGIELVGPFRVVDGVKMTAKLSRSTSNPGTRRKVCYSGKR